MVTLLLTSGVVLAGSREAHAWNEAGHLTIARIAWDEFTPAEQELVTQILSHHPHHETLLLKDRPPHVAKREWIFLRASVWPDDVRPPKSFLRDEIKAHPLYKFHRGGWHYVNFPYTAGQRRDDLPDRHLSDESNILTQLDLSMKVLTNKQFRDEDRVENLSREQNRAVRLAWLLHLVGDLHQPMHVIALVDQELFPQPPHHDQGGNRLAVRTESDSDSRNLHWIWDEMFSTDGRFDQVRQQAERLSHDPVLKLEIEADLTNHVTFRDWAKESYQSAKSNAYLDGRLERVLVEGIGEPKISQQEVPVFPPTALKQARQVAQRRVLLAGRRLVAKIREAISR